MNTGQLLSKRFVRGILCLLILLPILQLRAAEPDTNAVLDPFPLRPPDLSSPRDTLRSFITSTDKAAEAWLRNTQDRVSDHAWRSALLALDFSATPDSDSWSVQTERAIFLKEILDRVELPPDRQIPGDAEVAKDNLSRWTIPNTSITIARIDSGLHASDFLFSADTVERLPGFYSLAVGLPYRPTASNTGIYNAYTNSSRTLLVFEKQLRARLRKADTSSPRSTLKTFAENMDRAYALIMDADKALKAYPPAMTRQQALASEKAAYALLRRATATLDLSQVPEAHRRAEGLEAALKLKEIIDRTLLPSLENIPDLAMVAGTRHDPPPSPRPAQPFRWRYPNTDIEIVQIQEGDRQGEFLFSAGTVAQIRDFYDRVSSLPYRTEMRRAEESIYTWSKVSENFHEYFITNPGSLVPRATFLGSLVAALPAWFKTFQGGLTAWQWTGLFVSVLAALLAARLGLRILKRLAEALKPPLQSWLMAIAPVLILLIIIAVNHFIGSGLNITGQARTTSTTALKILGILTVIWAVSRLCTAIAETAVNSPKLRDRTLDASLLRIAMRLTAFLIGSWILIVSLRELGADLLPLLAGLGVGGLAVALAAQRTFANFIGSLILFANKPIKPGDFCRYGDQIGTVEHIGLLSTQIRSLERSIVTVPNAELSEMKLDNFSKRDQRLFKTLLQLRYETTPEQMRFILARLRQLLISHPKVLPDPARVRFVGYDDFSKNLEIFAYLDCQDQNIFLAIQEDLLLRVEDIVNEAGSGFAFPSQTTYLTRDKGLDDQQVKKAELQVELWRKHGKLPFPEFDRQQRDSLQNTLDYPPKGSPDHTPVKPPSSPPPEPEISTFSQADLHDLPALAARLNETTPLADYIRNRLPEDTRNLLASYTGGHDLQLSEALLQALNDILLGPAIYEPARFSRIQLREETRDLLATNPDGQNLVRLNRLLLEDAYPRELQPPPTKTSTRHFGL